MSIKQKNLIRFHPIGIAFAKEHPLNLQLVYYDCEAKNIIKVSVRNLYFNRICNYRFGKLGKPNKKA
jgi:hypothetical protein